jgi:hypothetical protein
MITELRAPDTPVFLGSYAHFSEELIISPYTHPKLEVLANLEETNTVIIKIHHPLAPPYVPNHERADRIAVFITEEENLIH